MTEHKSKKHAKHQHKQKAHYRPNAVQQPWSVKPIPEHLKPKPSLIDKAYKPNSHMMEEYEREAPGRFAEERDDRLMHSMIMKYALEGRTDNKPNGHFYMTEDAMKRVTDEVIGTHFGFTGEKKTGMVKDAMSSLWPRYDVNHDGYIEVARAATFLRSAVGDVTLNIGLQ